MPIIAIAGAVVAGAIAAPAIGALIGGATLAAAGGLTAALEITGAVGATLGAVGAITKDKGLETAGLIIGGIGGVGALANEAGVLGDTSNLFGALDQIPSSVDITGPVEGAASGGAADFAAGATGTLAGTSEDYINMFTPQPNFNNIPDNASVSIDETGNVVVATPDQPIAQSLSAQEGITPTDAAANPSDLAEQAAKAAVQPGSATTASVTPVSGPTAPPAAAPAPGVTPMQAAGGGGAAAPAQTPGVATAAPAAAPQSTADANQSWFEKNIIGHGNLDPNAPTGLKGLLQSPGAAYGLIQVAGNAFSSLTPAQAANQRAQANQNNAAASLAVQQLANIQSGIPTARLAPVKSAPVTGSPAGLSPPGPVNPLAGVINSNTVTGVPA
jgi:hypothetical protein